MCADIAKKKCPECGQFKPHDDFNKNRRQFDGLATWCRQCEKDYRAANRDKRRYLRVRVCGFPTLLDPEENCTVELTGTGKRWCDEHRELSRLICQDDAYGRARASRAQARTGRTCQECAGEIPAQVKLDAKYCGKRCRDAVDKRRQHADYHANRQAILDQDRAHRLANPRLGTLAAARSRAKRVGVPFGLTLRDLPEDLGACVVCDRALAIGSGRVTPASPTIDRTRPELGYVPGNVLAWVCFGCNARKHNKTLAELAGGAAGEHWQAWALDRLAAQEWRPDPRKSAA